MNIVHTLEELSGRTPPVILTIGNFDGVHLGHQAILQHILSLAKKEKTSAAVITFANHPTEVLRPTSPTPLLCTTEHKLKLLGEMKIDHVVLLQFTKEFSEQTAESFLTKVQRHLPFKILVLGNDAHLGKEREGDPSTVAALSKKLGFEVEYYPEFSKDGKRITSTLVRSSLQKGNLAEASSFLARPYSIYSSVLRGSGKGALLGYPTANIAVGKLCLPPFGVYAVTLRDKEKTYPGVANLGKAPTVHQDRLPILEVHLFEQSIDLYDKTVDVHFHGFIRPEKRFESLDALKSQIATDVATAKRVLQNLKINLNFQQI